MTLQTPTAFDSISVRISGINLLSFDSTFANDHKSATNESVREFLLDVLSLPAGNDLDGTFGYQGLPFSDFGIINLFLQCGFIIAMVQFFGLLLKIRKHEDFNTITS